MKGFTWALLLAGALVLPAAVTAATLQSSAALTRALGTGGRAEATLRYGLPGPGGVTRVVHATLTLEPPSLARIDVSATGEKIVTRADGGEWLQPSTKQLVRFHAEQAAPALQWWRVLLATDRSAKERALGNNRYILTLPSEQGTAQRTLPGGQGTPSSNAAEAATAEVWLDAHGLPTRLIVPAGDPQGSVYRLGGWRFMRARGEAAFKLPLPAGYESVELP